MRQQVLHKLRAVTIDKGAGGRHNDKLRVLLVCEPNARRATVIEQCHSTFAKRLHINKMLRDHSNLSTIVIVTLHTWSYNTRAEPGKNSQRK
jgi:hypothetical protein